VFLAGCTNVSEYYSPQVKSSEWVTVGSCGNKFEIFKRKISDGIFLEMTNPLNILFRLDAGNTVKFTSNAVSITKKGSNDTSKITIEKIRTGVFPEMYKGLYNIPEQKFNALEEFQGIGAYKNIEMQWGEWSSFRGNLDIFRIDLSKYIINDHETLIVELPNFFAQGKLVEVEPIEFKWKKSTSLGCVQ